MYFVNISNDILFMSKFVDIIYMIIVCNLIVDFIIQSNNIDIIQIELGEVLSPKKNKELFYWFIDV